MNDSRLIVNADDIGLSRGITDGILVAHREGIVTSTSLMVNQPASEYAIQQLPNAPKLGVGIHLNLCEGYPVLQASQVPSLVNDYGKFYPAAQIIRRLLRWRVSPREIEAEFRAQIRWMKDRGRQPSHADSHHHLHLYPSVVGPFRRALQSEGIRHARAARCRHWPRNGYIGDSHGGRFYRRLLVTLYNYTLQCTAFHNLILPDYCVVPPPFYRRNWKLIGEGWKLAVKNLPPGTYELTCHPGFSNGASFSEEDGFRGRREMEIGYLTDPELGLIIKTKGIKLISYREL